MQGVAVGVPVLVAVGGVPVTVGVWVAAGPARQAATMRAVLFIESALWAELGAFSSTPVGQPLYSTFGFEKYWRRAQPGEGQL